MNGTPTSAARASRSGTSFKKVAFVFVALLGIGIALGSIVYRRFVAYTPVAARHVPRDASLLLRFDLTHVTFHEPFRQVWLGLADQLPKRPESRGRTERLRTEGLDLAADTRELTVALGPEPGGWTLVLGGTLEAAADRIVAATLEMEEGLSLVRQGPVFSASTASPSFAFAQASDRAFILASSAERVRAVLEPRTADPVLSRGAGGLLMRESSLVPPMQSASGSFRAGSVLALDGELSYRTTSSEEERTRAWETATRVIGGDDPTLLAALSATEFSGTGSTRAVSVRLPREAVQVLANRAAAAILR